MPARADDRRAHARDAQRSVAPLRQEADAKLLDTTSLSIEEAVQQVRELLSNDDGKEFIMLNLVRHRPKALYPAGLNYGDDPREADRLYGA